MFGLLISGRLVDTNFREVDATHAVIDVLDADSFNHVVVSSTFLKKFVYLLTYLFYFRCSIVFLIVTLLITILTLGIFNGTTTFS